jgi:hypothetical protein
VGYSSSDLLKIKRNLGCPPSSRVIVGREKQNVAPKVEGILTNIYVRKREGPWRCYHPL